VLTDLFDGRIVAVALRLLLFLVEADRATQWRDDLEWLVARIDAGARGLEPVGAQVLGHFGAAERIDGYVAAVLEDLADRSTLATIEDDLFRFMRIVDGSDELRSALTSRDLTAAARKSLVDDLLQSRTAPATVRLAAYVTQVGRPRDYEILLSHLVDQVAAESNRRVAEVRAPIDLDGEQLRLLGLALRRVAGRDVEVRVTVDASVLGGFVATIGDIVVDGSARHRLDLLKERLGVPEAPITIGEPT
jgi:F-type H+-transporting ATPase subunit delta